MTLQMHCRSNIVRAQQPNPLLSAIGGPMSTQRAPYTDIDGESILDQVGLLDHLDFFCVELYLNEFTSGRVQNSQTNIRRIHI